MLPELPPWKEKDAEAVVVRALRGDLTREVEAALDGLARRDWELSDAELRERAFKNLFYVGTQGSRNSKLLALEALANVVRHTDSRECFEELLRTYRYVLRDRMEGFDEEVKECCLDNLGAIVPRTDDPGLQYATIALLNPTHYTGSRRSAAIDSLQEAVLTVDTHSVREDCIASMLSVLPDDPETVISETTKTLIEALSSTATEIDDELLTHRIFHHSDYVRTTRKIRSQLPSTHDVNFHEDARSGDRK